MPDPADEAEQHARWMNEAIALARAGMRIHGGGPFGAVIVAAGELVGRGCNQVTPLLDPTAHATRVASPARCVFPRSIGPGSTASILPPPATTPPGSDSTTIFIYQQIPLELAARSLPMVQLQSPTAADLFSEWVAKPDKVPY